MNRWFRFCAVLLFVAGAFAAFAAEMPVFRLRPPVFNDDVKAKAHSLFVDVLGGNPVAIEQRASMTYKLGQKYVEVDKRSGHVFMGDFDQLWNPTLRPTLPSQARAQQIADKFLSDYNLTPRESGRVRYAFSHYSETVAIDDDAGAVPQILDRQVNYKVEITMPDAARVPVYGAGAKYKVTIGNGDKVIGFIGGWREVDKVEAKVPVLPEADAKAKFSRQFADPNALSNVEARLVYYAAPGFETQDYLAPVWIVSADIQAGSHTFHTRETIIPATSYGPNYAVSQSSRPAIRASAAGDEQPTQQGWRAIPRQLLDLLGPTAANAQTQTQAQEPTTYECGTAYIGTTQLLMKSAANTQGFLDQCTAANWRNIFDHGDAAAVETDWRRNNNSVVDDADLVFYTGHAGWDGWAVNKPDDGVVSYTEITTKPTQQTDLWGNNDLEWLIVAACGPHQDRQFSSVRTTAVDRWRGAFNGLHSFLAYGSVTLDNDQEGALFMQLARSGKTVIEAWFETGEKVQPAGVYVTAIYAHNGDHCAGKNDHLWGMGATCADVPAGTNQRLRFIFTTT